MRTCLAAAALLALAAPAAAAQDAARGADLAGQSCTGCHHVAPGGPYKMYPPSFAAIATYRARDQIIARIWMPPLHSNMPTGVYDLTADDVDDLVAYITSLDGTAE